jgi:hypothetical protein
MNKKSLIRVRYTYQTDRQSNVRCQDQKASNHNSRRSVIQFKIELLRLKKCAVGANVGPPRTELMKRSSELGKFGGRAGTRLRVVPVKVNVTTPAATMHCSIPRCSALLCQSLIIEAPGPLLLQSEQIRILLHVARRVDIERAV